MHAGQHTLSRSAQKLAIALPLFVGLVFFAYFIVITVVVVGQAVAGLG